MIRVTIISKNPSYKNIIETFLKQNMNDFEIQEFSITKQYDIYFIEVQKQDDLEKYTSIKRNDETLIYIIGPEEFQIIQRSLTFQIDLYFKCYDLQKELHSYKDIIISHIQQHFHYYTFQNGSMKVKMRLADIFYIESLRHHIIIHSINGEFHERKNLKDLIKELSCFGFVQVHKSFVVNKKKIKDYNSKEVYLKNGEVIPLGRIYKEFMN